MNLLELIHKLVLEGIEVTIFKDHTDGKIKYNLNSGAKSHLYLYTEDGSIRYEGRYDDSGYIDDYSDVLRKMREYFYMRDFASQDWINLLVKEGFLSLKVETKTTYSYS